MRLSFMRSSKIASVMVPLSKRMACKGNVASGGDDVEEMMVDDGSGTF